MFWSGPVAALYMTFGGSHPHVWHTNVLACCPSTESALPRRGESYGWPVLSQEGSGNTEVESRKPAQPGPGPGLEVAQHMHPHPTGYGQAVWHD